MSGRHDRANADARVRAGGSGVPADGTYRHGEGRRGTDHDTAGHDGAGPDSAGQEGAGRHGVSGAGAGDGLGMTDRSGAGEPRGSDRDLSPATDGPTVPMDAVARRTPTGWRVGDEEVPDLTSAMVLADLLAAELSAEEQADLDAAAAAAPPPPPREAAARNTGQLGGVSTPRPPADRTSPSGAGRRAWPGSAPWGTPGGGDPVRPGRRRPASRSRAAEGDGRAAGTRADRQGPGGAGHRGTGRTAPDPAPAGLRAAQVSLPGSRAEDHGDGQPGDCQRDQPAAPPAGGTGQAADAAPASPAQPWRGLTGPAPGNRPRGRQPNCLLAAVMDIPEDPSRGARIWAGRLRTSNMSRIGLSPDRHFEGECETYPGRRVPR